MKTACIISGATGGLGQHIVIEALKKNLADKFILLYRNEKKKQDLKAKIGHVKKEIIFIEHDMSVRYPAGIFHKEIFEDISELVLILAAIDIKPIKKIQHMTKDEVFKNIHTNVLGQIELLLEIDQIVSSENIHMRIICVDSGAAYECIEGWSLYSCARNYINKFLEYINLEENHDIVLYSPGVMNTSMQKYIRSVDANDFPEVAKFKEKHSSGQLRKPDMVAHDMIERYIADWTAKEFREKVSNIEMRERSNVHL